MGNASMGYGMDFSWMHGTEFRQGALLCYLTLVKHTVWVYDNDDTAFVCALMTPCLQYGRSVVPLKSMSIVHMIQ